MTDRRTDRQTDRQTDGRTDRIAISISRVSNSEPRSKLLHSDASRRAGAIQRLWISSITCQLYIAVETARKTDKQTDKQTNIQVKCVCPVYFVLWWTLCIGGAGSLHYGSEEERLEEVDQSHEPHADIDVDVDAEHHPRPRRRRSFYTRCQLAFLEAAFNRGGHYPDQRQRRQLARALDVTEARVQVGVSMSLSKMNKKFSYR